MRGLGNLSNKSDRFASSKMSSFVILFVRMYVQQINKTIESKRVYGGQIRNPDPFKQVAISRIRDQFELRVWDKGKRNGEEWSKPRVVKGCVIPLRKLNDSIVENAR
jgi:hypothetical protein